MKLSLHIETDDASELTPLLLALVDPQRIAELIAEGVAGVLTREDVREIVHAPDAEHGATPEASPELPPVREPHDQRFIDHADAIRQGEDSPEIGGYTPPDDHVADAGEMVTHGDTDEASVLIAPPVEARPSPPEKRGAWTPEKREAARQRAREQWASRREATGGSIGRPTKPLFKPSPETSPEPDYDHEPLPVAWVATATCTCPPWWCAPREQSRWKPEPGAWHYETCPRHLHRHVLPSAPREDGAYEGRCECGDVELRRPYNESRRR